MIYSYWALYLGRPTTLKPTDISPACLHKDFDALIKSQTRTYAYEKTIETRVYEALLQLMDLLVPLCETRDLQHRNHLCLICTTWHITNHTLTG